MNSKLIETIIVSSITINTFTASSLGLNSNKIHVDKSKNTIKNVKSISTVYSSNKLPLIDFFKNVFKDDSSDTNKTVSSKEYNWYFQPRNDGKPPEPQKEASHFLSKHDCYYLGDTSKKVLYLTFDEGYENGHTSEILDTLKKHNVKAAFFVVKPYITSNPDIIKRMVEEGHLVCNHSARHPSMASIKDQSKFNKELSDVEEAYKDVIGKDMPKYFRPPMGKFSDLSLYYTEQYGYKTIFWSFAYNDWDVKKQPSHQYAKKKILDRTHNGAIVLLHAVSKTNAEILDEILTEWETQGFEIKTLDDLPEKNKSSE